MMEGLPGGNRGGEAGAAAPLRQAHQTPDPTAPENPPPERKPDPDDVPAPARAPVKEPDAPDPPIRAA